MEPYAVFLNLESLQQFSALTSAQRRVLVRIFGQLSSFPEQLPDVDFPGPHQVPYRAKRFGDWELTYRIDSPVRQIQILGIKKL